MRARVSLNCGALILINFHVMVSLDMVDESGYSRHGVGVTKKRFSPVNQAHRNLDNACETLKNYMIYNVCICVSINKKNMDSITTSAECAEPSDKF